MSDEYLISIGFASKDALYSDEKPDPKRKIPQQVREKNKRKEEKNKQRGFVDKTIYMIGKSLLDFYFKDKKFVHCEVAFVEERQGNMCLAAGVFEEDGVFFKYRTFDNPHYTYITLSVSETQYSRIRKFCLREANKKCQFDFYGSKMSVIWPASTKGKWWCIPFVICALQQGGILLGYRPESLDADDIYYILNNCNGKVLGLPPNTLEDKTKSAKFFSDAQIF